MTVRVALVGLGPIGIGIGKALADRSDVQLVGAADINPDLAQRSLGDLLGIPRVRATISPTIRDATKAKPDVTVLATSSRLESVAPQILELVEAGCSVVSTCEELAYPWRQSTLARHIDERARAQRVTVVGVGVNPGFAMDLLPIVMTAPCPSVTSVRVERVVDAAARRLPFQKKVGVGMTREEFEASARAGRVGHVGLRESADMIAGALGWTIDSYDETLDPVDEGGKVLGLHQTASARMNGVEIVSYDLVMVVGASSRDELWIRGPLPMHVLVEGGIHGDVATVSIAVNSVIAAPGAPKGLYGPYELPVAHWRRPGSLVGA